MKKELRSGLKHLLTGVLIGYAITIIGFITYAILLTYTSLSENNIGLVVTVISVLSVLLAGFDAARAQTRRGWLWGLGAGLTYGLLLIGVMNSLATADIDLARASSLLALCLAGGGLGGVVGINFKKK